MNATPLQSAAPLVAIAFPLLIAVALAVPRLRPWACRVAPWAALPALGLAIGVPSGATVELPWMLVRTRLYAPDALTRGFLLLTAVVWLAAGWFAPAYMAKESNEARFWAFFLASLAGNVGLVIARDVASFYSLFALMTFAAYGLVVHEQTPEARRAAQVYFVVAFLGELLLLAAFLLIARDGGVSVTLERARRIVAASPHGELVALLLWLGFGVKAGVIPLHVWLPLAHPVAPTPASAVLSGAMIKAGLLGWLRLLPLGIASLHDLGWLIATTGFIAALFGGVVGATQREAKTVLAYSSISQIGIMTLVVGVLVASPVTASISLAAVVYFAVHHAFAKGSLFLGTAVARDASRRWTCGFVTVGLLVPALAIAGAPLTSGALGKIALHDAVEGAAREWHVFGTLLSVAAIASTLVMIRFLVCAVPRVGAAREAPRSGMWLPWLALTLCDVLVLFFSPVDKPPPADLLKASKLWSAAWPVLSGAAIAGVAWWLLALRRARPPVVPAGDVLCLVDDLWTRARRGSAAVRGKVRGVMGASSAVRVGPFLWHSGERALRRVERLQGELGRYGVIGSLLAILLLLIAATLMRRAS